MNRKQRRLASRQVRKQLEVEKQKDEAKAQAAAMSVNVVFSAVMLVLRDKYGFGKKRAQEFMGHFEQVFEDVHNGLLSIEDIVGVVEDELGINMGKVI